MIWQEASQAMFEKLEGITLADVVERVSDGKCQKLNQVFSSKT